MVDIFKVQKPRDNFTPIVANVVAPMLLRIKRGPGGDILTPSQSGSSKHLNCEFTFTDGPHKGAKAFQRLTVEGSSETAKSISLGLIGSMVRSAMGVKSDDTTAAVEARMTNFDYEDLDGLRFVGKTGRIERGKPRDPSAGPNSVRYDDKTTIACGVTPDMTQEWEQWKNAPRGFNLDESLDGVMEPNGSLPNGSVHSGAPIDDPPWAS